MLNIRILSFVCCALPIVFLVGCGGSSGSNEDQTDVLTGRFIDSPVAGLSYRTATQSGMTNSNGEFSYLAGETVVFGLGDLEFPAVTATQILTPLEMAGVTDINDTGVVNIARLLQSLDKDCDPGNGITISGEALLAAAGLSLDFEAASFDSDVANLVANAGQNDPSCMVLIDASQAVAHLQSTLDALNDQTEPPIDGGLAGKVGIWEGEGQQQGISWTIRADLRLDEQLIEYPSLNCGGFWELIEETEVQLSFRETITFGNSRCVDQGLVELTDQSANELIFRYYFPDGAGGFQDEVGAIGNLNRTQSVAVDNFLADKEGICTDMDGAYGCQCVDLMHSYIEEVLGVPRSDHNIRGNAYPIYTGLAASTTISSGTRRVRLDKIDKTPAGIPQKGDIIFWTHSNGVGHVGIFLSGDVNSFQSLDQNWVDASATNGSAAARVNHTYTGSYSVAGWLRPVLLAN